MLKSCQPKHWSAELGGTQVWIYGTILSTRQETIVITYNDIKGEPKELKMAQLWYSFKEDIIERSIH
jgi:hypothetical protein